MNGINNTTEVKNSTGHVVGTVTTLYRSHTYGVGFCTFDSEESAKKHILNIAEGRFVLPTSEPILFQVEPDPISLVPAPEPKVNLKHLDSMTRKRVVVEERIKKKMKYLVEFPELGLKSVEPHKIVGAVALWVFNVKTRKLGIYQALKNDYLAVKGSTVLNFNPDSSVQKTIRKPKEFLSLIKLDGVIDLITFNSVKAVETPMTGRINKDTILLKVS